MGNTHDTEIARLEADIQTKWKTSDDYRWGYGGDRGPDTWWIHYPSASGGKQSPIDIITEETNLESDYGQVPIKINYHIPPSLHQSTDSLEENMETKILVNNGTTARVNIVNSHSYITGGPCKGYTYVLEQFHLHWGESDTAGSEHYVDGYPRTAELHLVHWNEDLYGSYEEAARSDEGIIILAVFIKISETRSNQALNDIGAMLEDILYREQNVPLPREFPVENVLPDDIDKYWTYEGSFCTPPCYETVTWVVFEEPIFIGSKVLNQFRELRCYGENEDRPRDERVGELNTTRRPIQPIGARKVTYVDCDLFRDSHALGEQRPFRNVSGNIGGRRSTPFGVGLQTFQTYISKYSRDGIHGCSRGG